MLICLLLAGGFYVFHAPHGLSGSYYQGAYWTDLPDRPMAYFDKGGRRIDRTVNFHPADFVSHYPFPQQLFSVEWQGYVFLPEGYQPGLNSNFGAWLYIDDTLAEGASIIDFGTPGAHPRLREGWSYDERWSRDRTTFLWSSGSRSEFYLGVDELTDYILIFRCMPFTYPESPKQELTMAINKTTVAAVPLEEGWHTYRVKIPQTILQAIVPGFFRVQFSYTSTARPSEVLPQSRDSRQLAVAYDFAMLQKADAVPLDHDIHSPIPELTPGMHQITLKAYSDGIDPFIQLLWKSIRTDRTAIIPQDYLFPQQIHSANLLQQFRRERFIFSLILLLKWFLLIFLLSVSLLYIDVRGLFERFILWTTSWKTRAFITASAAAGVGISAFLLTFRLYYLIDLHAVNILYWDQWDLYEVFFRQKNLWELFLWQHGPHRQGIGFLFSKLAADLSGWNTRTEVFAIGGLICCAMLLALWLKKRLVGSFSWTDVAIPLIILTPAQHGIFFNTPNPSHGAFPLLLLMSYCLAWTLSAQLLRCTAVLIVNFLLIYTGFGIFIGVITPCLFAVEAFHAFKHHKTHDVVILLSCLLLSLLSAGSFFIGYTFDPTVPNFQFPFPQYWQYPQYVALAFANVCGVKGIGLAPQIVGSLVFVIVLAVSSYHLLQLVRFGALLKTPGQKKVQQRTKHIVIFTLTIFSVIFAANIAIGRISLGLETAQSSRYVPYILPAFLGVYLHIITMSSSKIRTFVSILAVIGMFAASFPLRIQDAQAMKWLSDGKTRWKNLYFQIEDIEQTDRLTQFNVYPWPAATDLQRKLDYFKEHTLNLYRDTLPEK